MVVEVVESPEASAPPVFVDPSGRRSRRMAWAGRSFAAVMIGYLVLLGAGMARAPWVPRLGLPGIGPLVTGNKSSLPPVLPNAVLTPTPTTSTVTTTPAAVSPHAPTGSSVAVTSANGAAVVTPQSPGRSTAPGRTDTTIASPPTTPTPTSRPGRGHGPPSTKNPHAP